MFQPFKWPSLVVKIMPFFIYMDQLYIIKMMYRLVKLKNFFKGYKKLKLKQLKLLVLDSHNRTGLHHT
jgi:hypothetical protein